MPDTIVLTAKIVKPICESFCNFALLIPSKMTMAKDKVFRVFVSSTYDDLKEERLAVMNALIEKNCIPIGMEQFPACNQKQIEHIKKRIDSVDYYILIIGGRYGSIEKKSKKSYTQLEYEYAKEKGIPIASFVIANIEELKSTKVERTERGRKRLDAFCKIVMADKMCKKWNNPDDLARHVQNSIEELIESSPREGWVRPSSIAAISNNTRDSGFDLDQIVDLHPITNNPFSLLNDDELVHQTTWKSIVSVLAPIMKNPTPESTIEETLIKAFAGISHRDIEMIIERMRCLGLVDNKVEGNYRTGYINLMVLSEKGWQVYGEVKGY